MIETCKERRQERHDIEEEQIEWKCPLCAFKRQGIRGRQYVLLHLEQKYGVGPETNAWKEYHQFNLQPTKQISQVYPVTCAKSTRMLKSVPRIFQSKPTWRTPPQQQLQVCSFSHNTASLPAAHQTNPVSPSADLLTCNVQLVTTFLKTRLGSNVTWEMSSVGEFWREAPMDANKPCICVCVFPLQLENDRS